MERAVKPQHRLLEVMGSPCLEVLKPSVDVALEDRVMVNVVVVLVTAGLYLRGFFQP